MSSTSVLGSNGVNADAAGVLVDPSGVLFGTNWCERRNFMKFVDLSGVETQGNSKNHTYLQGFGFPSKIKFT